jgi:predicted  nucleic acid-binding Zn-ribbon protein
MSVQDELRDLASQITIRQQQKTRAEIELDNAKAKRDEAVRQLHQEFGVTTGADIATKRSELEAELADALAEAKKALLEAS